MSREAFEAWIADATSSDLHRGIMLDRHENGRYRHLATENKWNAWQAATNAMEAKCASLAAENAALKAAFDKPQAYLSWHAIPPTWEDPLPCGEYLDVHDDAGHKNSDGTDCWPVYAKPEIETPATDAFLAEVRASELDSLAGVAETMLVKFSNRQCSAYMHDVIGWRMVHQQASNRAAQLRQEAAQ